MRGPRTLIFLRNYWCFCVPTISHQKVIFHRKTQNRTFSSFLPFLQNSSKKVKFLQKVSFGVQDPSKCMKKHWSYKHPRLPAARVRKCANHRKNKKVVRNFSLKIVNNHEIHQILIKIMILSMSKHQVFLRKYLTF